MRVVIAEDSAILRDASLLTGQITLMALALYIMYLIVSTALDKTVNSISELKAKTGLDASGEFPLLPQANSAKLT